MTSRTCNAGLPRVSGRSYAIEAELTVPEGGAEGVILANADFIGGFGLWVDDQGMLYDTDSFLGVESYKQTATEKLPTGDVTVRMQFMVHENTPGTGGRSRCSRTTRRSARARSRGRCPSPSRAMPVWTWAATTAWSLTGRNEDKAPYAFTGTVRKVVFDLKPAVYEDEKETT